MTDAAIKIMHAKEAYIETLLCELLHWMRQHANASLDESGVKKLRDVLYFHMEP